MTDDSFTIFNPIPEPDGDNYGADHLGGVVPFLIPERYWTPAPFTIPGSLLPTETKRLWIRIGPAWQCDPVVWGGANSFGYLCPPPGLCAVHGPRCSGEANSGQVDSINLHGRSIPRGVTYPTPASAPYTDPETGVFTRTYRTSHAYEPGSLHLAFQGITLVKGVDYEETDPSSGLFTLLKTLTTDSAAELSISYMGYGEAFTDATTYPDYPANGGYPVPPPLPGEGGIYRPANQRQFGWGTVYDSVNCAMACSAMALDRHTLGRNTRYLGSPLSTPPAHRFYSGVTAVVGTGHDDVSRAWSTGWGESLTRLGNIPWGNLVYQVQSGRGVIVFGRYAYMASGYKKSATFDGPHAVYINDQLSDGSFWGYDPIVGYPIVYPHNVLRTYADSYNGFSDRMSCSFTRVTPRV